jgi:fibronectin type 3 domain-containing protein
LRNRRTAARLRTGATLAVLLAVLLGMLVVPAAPSARADGTCTPYTFLGSRGSGERLQDNGGYGPTVDDFRAHVSARLGATQVTPWPNPYAAVGVLEAILNAIGHGSTYALPFQLTTYRMSVNEGVRLLRTKIQDVIAACASTKIILAGYSQGGQVSAEAYQQLTTAQSAHVLGMALFGEPLFNPKSLSARGNHSERRYGLLTFLGARKRSEFREPGKVFSYCRRGDVVCQGLGSGTGTAEHGKYPTDGDEADALTYTERAANDINQLAHPGSGVPKAAVTVPAEAYPGVPVELSGEGSLDSNGAPLSYAWDVDGNGYGAAGSSPDTTAVFAAPGDRTVRLRVANPAGTTAVATATVHVIADPGPPGVPTAVRSTPLPDGSGATLSWEPPASGGPFDSYALVETNGVERYVIGAQETRGMTLSKVELPATVQVIAMRGDVVGEPSAPVTMTARANPSSDDLSELWRQYGNAGGHWTGGDRTTSVVLPDGRTAWLFSDTFLGTVDADGSRPRSSPMVHNSLVLQAEDGSLGQTLTGGTPSAPAPLVERAGSTDQYWVGDGQVGDGGLQVLYNTYRVTGGGALDVKQTGTSLVTFDLPALTVASITALPLGDDIAWGSALLDDGEYTYVYGSEDPGDGTRFAHVARTLSGDLGGAWEFWDGSGWSGQESASARLIRGVGTAYSVVGMGTHYALITQETNEVFGNSFVAYTSDSPTGPFSGPAYLFDAPAEYPGKPVIEYDPHVHAQYGTGAELMMSYNVNSLSPDDNYEDATIYRPRFVSVPWPPAAPGAGVPGAPTGIAAAMAQDGVSAHVGWTAPAGSGLTYRVYWRDVTAGQQQFTRVGDATPETAMDVAGLKDGHTYGFRVTAQNAVGEGPPSNGVTLAVDVATPQAPSGLTATAGTAGDVALAWQPSPTPGVYYQVERRNVTAAETDFSTVPFGNATDTSLTVTGLEPGSSYEFRVRAVNGGGQSDPSNLAQATAAYALPPAPTGLVATPNADGTIGLAWNAVPDSWYFVYQKDLTDHDADFTKWELPATQASATAGFLAQDHQYEFRVSATNRGGEGPQGAGVTATSHAVPPAAPTGLTAVGSDHTATLTWTAGTPGLWYWIYRRDITADPNGAFQRLDLPAENPAFTDNLLLNTHTYEFKVAASNAGGEGPATAAVRVTPTGPLPPTPTGLTATPHDDNTITLNWTAPQPGMWYRIAQQDLDDPHGSMVDWGLPLTDDNNGQPTVTASGLNIGHRYRFQVSSEYAGQRSVPSKVDSRAQVGAPTGFTVRATSDGKALLSWIGPASGIDYAIYQDDLNDSAAPVKWGLYATDTSATADSLVSGHVYEFQVAAHNAGGEGPKSVAVRITASGGTPPAPTGLTASGGDGSATLRWSAVTGTGILYVIYRRAAGQNGFTRLALPVDGTTFTDGLLANGKAYEFRVAASNSHGEGAWSAAVSVTPYPPLPAAPTGLTATPGNGQVTLRWNAVPNSFYQVYSRDVTAGDPIFHQWGGLTAATSATHTALRNGDRYEYRVSAVDYREGPQSAVATATPSTPTPTGLTATAGPARVALSWNTVPNAWYFLYRRDTGGGSFQKIGPMTQHGMVDNVFLNNHTYEYKVSATAFGQEGPATATVSARPQPPSPPSGLTGSSGAVGQVSLRWSASSTGNVYYWIYLRTAGGAFTRLKFPVNGTSWTGTGLTGWGTYEFRVTATGSTGESAATGTVSVLVRGSANPPNRPGYIEVSRVNPSYNDPILGGRVFDSRVTLATYSNGRTYQACVYNGGYAAPGDQAAGVSFLVYRYLRTGRAVQMGLHALPRIGGLSCSPLTPNGIDASVNYTAGGHYYSASTSSYTRVGCSRGETAMIQDCHLPTDGRLHMMSVTLNPRVMCDGGVLHTAQLRLDLLVETQATSSMWMGGMWVYYQSGVRPYGNVKLDARSDGHFLGGSWNYSGSWRNAVPAPKGGGPADWPFDLASALFLLWGDNAPMIALTDIDLAELASSGHNSPSGASDCIALDGGTVRVHRG